MIETHVPSLDLCKKLKEAGYPQEGMFYWAITIDDKSILVDWCELANDGKMFLPKMYKDNFTAPLASELMDACIRKSNIVWKIFCSRHNEWLIYSSDNDCGFQAPDDFPEFVADTFCNALAKMYLYLAEQGLLGGTK